MGDGLSVEDVVNHEDNCAACGVHDRVDDSRYCAGCRDALVRTDGGTEQMFESGEPLYEGSSEAVINGHTVQYSEGEDAYWCTTCSLTPDGIEVFESTGCWSSGTDLDQENSNQ
jgi:hypothetical protein